ncbi:MAG: MlaD family protein [Salinisphaera sp.]|uniref:PqiB family protein n=1 Tax=Salinisphaera sp. TaxID=1914330 RepID=UPI003C79BB15
MAALIGIWVAATRVLDEGPTITIVFPTAEGLKAGKTGIHYNGLEIGTVRSIQLTPDHKKVVATAMMAPSAANLLVEDTKFWVVSPRVSGANVTGLGTIISGAYIGMEIGDSRKTRRDFVALNAPPIVSGAVPGRFFVLKSADLGSVDYGTPIFYRRLQVGKVVSYALDRDGQTLTIKVFVNSPYDRFVTPDTRFWQASGIDVSLSATGFSLQTQSILSMLVGGLAFETPPTKRQQPPAPPDTEFTLYTTRTDAYRPPPKNPQTYVLVFDQSVRGLAPGAPVEFRGIPIGEVKDIHAKFDANAARFTIAVTVTVDPERLGVQVVGSDADAIAAAAVHRRIVDALVARGLRAQLQTGSLLTGSLYVALDFFPDAPPFKVDWSQSPVHLATVPGSLQGINTKLAGIVTKLDQLPYKQIGDELTKALVSLNQTLASTRRTLNQANRLIEPDSQLDKTIGNLDKTLASARHTLDDANKVIAPNSLLERQLLAVLEEVKRTSREVRVLADYLAQHPEALIRGKGRAPK